MKLRSSFSTVLLVVLAFLCCSPSSGAPQRERYAHPAVVRNARLEEKLTSHQRNPFYQDARTSRALARHSWFGEGEMPVQTREAEKIPRREIYNVLVHAGFLPRQRGIQDAPQNL